VPFLEGKQRESLGIKCTGMIVQQRNMGIWFPDCLKTHIAMRKPPFEDVSPIKHGEIFHCHVSFQGCKSATTHGFINIWIHPLGLMMNQQLQQGGGLNLSQYLRLRTKNRAFTRHP